MSLEEIAFQVDHLAYRLDDGKARQAESLGQVHRDAAALRRRVEEALAQQTRPEAVAMVGDTMVRHIDWRIEKASEAIGSTPKNQALCSASFTVMGATMHLEFFPQGRDTTWMPGFCALFLWCSAGVQARYQLRVGGHRSAPDVDEYASYMGHGHSNFCYLEPQVDRATDSLVVGVDILSLSVRHEVAEGLRLVDRGPESLLRCEAAVLTQRGLDRVEWRIRNILKRAREIPCGSAICSPPFAIAGVREMLLEFYPSGVLPAASGPEPGGADGAPGAPGARLPGSEAGSRGLCGFYVRCSGCPAGESLVVTLFVGSAQKGPTKTNFDGNTARGLPEFCRLEDQVGDGGEDLVVGIVVQNPALADEVSDVVLLLPKEPPP